MTLVLQIALGILLGYLLIENRHSIFRVAGGFAMMFLVIAVVVTVGALIWYVGGDTVTAVSNYKDAGIVGQKVFFGVGFLIFLLLAVSMLAAVWVFASLLVPEKFVQFCSRFRKPQTPVAFATLSIAVLAFVVAYQIKLPPPLSDWEAAWTEYGLGHGMGYDGGSTFDLLLWQAFWPLNYILYKLRGSNPFSDTASIFGAIEEPGAPE